MGCLQSSTRKPEQQPRPPLAVAGVEHMGQLVTAMSREWEVATHNATMAALREAEAQAAAASAAAAPNGDAPAEAAAPEQSTAGAAAGG